MSNYVPPPRPTFAIGPLRGVENHPDLDTSKMSEEHRAAYAVRCGACLAPPLRRCTVGLYKYVPIHQPHDGRVKAGLAALAALRERLNREDTP